MQSTGAHSTAMPQQESAPPTDAAAATLTPASLIADGRYTRATCGMDRELLAMLRAAVKEDPAALSRLCTKLANNAAARLGGATARVSIIVAPPLGPPTCVYSEGADSLAVIWLMLDPLDIDSKQTTFIQQMESSRVRSEWMSALYKWSGTPTTRQHTALTIKIEEE